MAASALVVMSVAAKAQSGSILLYGNVNAGSSKSAADVKSSNFTINPGIGYQFNDNWTVGANLGFGTAKTGDLTKTNQFAAGPFVRYTENLSNTFAIYTQLQGGFSSSKTTTGNVEVKSNGFNVGLFPAVFVNVNKNFGLNLSFGGLDFTSSKIKDASNSSNSFNFTFGQSVNIGISKNFGGKK